MDFFRIFILGITTLFKSLVSFIKYFFIGLFNVIIFIPKYFVIGIISIFSKKKTSKQKPENKRLSFAILGLCFSIYLVCVFITSRWYVQGLKIKYLTNDIITSTEIIEEEEKNDVVEDDTPGDEDTTEIPDEGNNVETPDNSGQTNTNTNTNTSTNSGTTYYPNDYYDYLSVPFMNVNFDDLLKENSDTVGWIKVEGTKVNYPVVQSDDNDYYLKHAFNGNKNAGGWIFADYRVNFKDFGKNTIIYGHNMSNLTMFGSIPYMLKSNYLNNSSKHYIKISTPSSNSVWKVFSIYTIEPEVYYLKTNFKTEPYDKFLTTIKNRSIHDFGTDVTTDDKIITLSTCTNRGTKRIAVHAKMINIEYK